MKTFKREQPQPCKTQVENTLDKLERAQSVLDDIMSHISMETHAQATPCNNCVIAIITNILIMIGRYTGVENSSCHILFSSKGRSTRLPVSLRQILLWWWMHILVSMINVFLHLVIQGPSWERKTQALGVGFHTTTRYIFIYRHFSLKSIEVLCTYIL